MWTGVKAQVLFFKGGNALIILCISIITVKNNCRYSCTFEICVLFCASFRYYSYYSFFEKPPLPSNLLLQKPWAVSFNGFLCSVAGKLRLIQILWRIVYKSSSGKTVKFLPIWITQDPTVNHPITLDEMIHHITLWKQHPINYVHYY